MNSNAVLNITSDIAPTAFGVPTHKQTIVGVVVFIAFILIWVGTSMIMGYLFTGYGTEKISLGNGGAVALVGVTLWAGAKLFDYYKA